MVRGSIQISIKGQQEAIGLFQAAGWRQGAHYPVYGLFLKSLQLLGKKQFCYKGQKFMQAGRPFIRLLELKIVPGNAGRGRSASNDQKRLFIYHSPV